ncbi:NADPH-dependent assimilatory sulfite reductase hemoprotein subunit [Bythopirellula goksoeyrii]|uniref:Sulfite reductase [ferredoxin] n=1 Tax=Bythopirellula goksoeyrii TaxID=1400387 RepID=A0A5B9Q6S9_9BACT|nr:NADPH-dependent assimilatory sulfite reductase hemoprotein subunit [Bythopirellula goksoeyrii]QEG33235.1 Sulfite reductase [ferredoxin] [Bythopirellula goksoeyrii]
MSDDKSKKVSAVEKIKLASNYLLEPIPQELADGTDHFGKESIQLLKHHGTYQQDNRDERSKEGKSYSFMLRTAIPGGIISSEQLLAEMDLGDEVANSTLRITTRQGLQLHGVLKKNLKQAIRRINDVKLTTIAACGDVKRNVMCSPCPYKGDPVYDQMQDLAERLAIHLTPHTGAYYELWLTDEETGEKHQAGGSNGQVVEPIYGPTYLPRKFKFAIGLPGDNSADVYTNDVGLLAICENWRIVGYNILVGGSFGVTPSAKKTFAAVAQAMCFVTPNQAIDVATAIVKVQRDFGNRADRKVARMKYLIHDWGLDRFKQKVEEYYGANLPDPRPVVVHGFNDGMGWQAQGDGKWFYGLNVENGRIKDEGDFRLKTALREICSTMAPPLRLTPHQSIIFCDLAEKDRPKLFEILRRHGVPLSEDISNARRWSMACPALPTCGLAITESERVLPSIIDQLDVELDKLDLKDEVFTFRMTGCPNGCARPYNSDIGLVGKTAGKYTIFLGGRVCGDRLNFIYKDLVPEEEVIPDLVNVFRYFKEAREQEESFGDFCHRQGVEKLLAACDTVPK